jgi:hypothetical protein
MNLNTIILALLVGKAQKEEGVKVHHFHKVLSMPLLYLGASNSSRKPFNNTIWVAPKT